MRMTPTPCPTRHLSHHRTKDGAHKHAERTTNFSREMMNLAFLKTSETTSLNTDETRHPSVKKPPPTRKQVPDGNVIHDTRLTNHDVNNLDCTAHGSGQQLTERLHTTNQENILHEPKSHNTTLLQLRTCSATLTAKQRVLTNGGSHAFFDSVLESHDSQTSTTMSNQQSPHINFGPLHQLTSQHHALFNAPQKAFTSSKPHTLGTSETRHGTPHSLLFIDVLTRSFSNQTQIVLVQIQQPPSTTQT